ncbi:MAG: aminomethyltransferase beta-barrel domain-containing protein, partial [Minisyncoccia bacterium]
KAKDEQKDQSYFLWGLTQKQLKYILFPIGDYKKTEVRKLAQKFKLPSAERKESQEICFINKSYFDFLKSKVSNQKYFKPGPILDVHGKEIGRHYGLPFYTIGQRKGLGGGQKNPLFVIEIDKKNNSLIVGEEKFLYQKKCLLEKLNFIEGKIDEFPLSIKAKIRYQAPEEKCQLYLEKEKVILEFNVLQRAITPGQSAVFYQKSQLLGGGIIKKVLFN